MSSKAVQEVSFDVEGMTCASCALRIERILQREAGVSSAVVSFAGQEARATVDHDVDLAMLETAVAKIGYQITPIPDGAEFGRRSSTSTPRGSDTSG